MKAILFDAGNTLVWLDHDFILALLREHGVERTMQELLEAEHGAKLLLDELVRTGRAGDDAARGKAFFAEIFRRLGVPDEAFPPLAQRLFARHQESNLWGVVRERTVETLEALRARGYRLGVISNADGRVEALLETVGLRPHFEFVIDSGEVGMEKPDPRIFHLGCERLGVAPSDTAYVGDIYEIDVAGARGGDAPGARRPAGPLRGVRRGPRARHPRAAGPVPGRGVSRLHRTALHRWKTIPVITSG